MMIIEVGRIGSGTEADPYRPDIPRGVSYGVLERLPNDRFKVLVNKEQYKNKKVIKRLRELDPTLPEKIEDW